MRPALSAAGGLRAATLDLDTPSEHDDSPAGVRCNYLRLVKPRVVMRYLIVVVLLLAACVSTSRVFEVKPGVYSVSTTGGNLNKPLARAESIRRTSAPDSPLKYAEIELVSAAIIRGRGAIHPRSSKT